MNFKLHLGKGRVSVFFLITMSLRVVKIMGNKTFPKVILVYQDMHRKSRVCGQEKREGPA
jgi:hypothetical protein